MTRAIAYRLHAAFRRRPGGEVLARTCITAGVIALLTLLSATAASAAPSGDNGTVKIHEGATETEPIVRDEPHVCTFHLHFFFADPFQSGDWWIESWPPADDRTTVLSGTYDTDPEGEDRQPTTGTYALPDGHYQLTWEVRPDQTAKHKTFWVECSPTESPPAVESPPSGSSTPTPTPTPTPTGGVLSATSAPRLTPPATAERTVPETVDHGWSAAALLLLAAGSAGLLLVGLVPRGSRR